MNEFQDESGARIWTGLGKRRRWDWLAYQAWTFAVGAAIGAGVFALARLAGWLLLGR